MEENNEHIDILIAKVAMGEAEPQEEQQLTDWENQSEENRLYVARGKKVLGAVAFVEVDTQAAWNKLKQRIDEGEEAHVVPMMVPEHNNKRSPYIMWAAAASVVLIIGAFFLFKSISGTDKPLAAYDVATDNSILNDTLPDGSTIFVNKHSKIEFAESKSGERTVKLKGEAFFEVKHNDEKPFVIQVNNAFVKDLGTGFNVKEDATANTVTVVVETGVVDFYTADNKGITLKAGETGVYNGSTKAFSKVENESNPNALSYKTKVFNFKADKLGNAVMQLNIVYGSNIVFENDMLKDCDITVDFNNEELDIILDMITAPLSLHWKKEDGKIIIYGTGC